MADANLMTLAYVAESTFGVTPSGPPTLKEVRFTGESLGMDTDTTLSEEVRADRQEADIVRTSIRGAGEINGELSYDAYDDWLLAALQAAAWTSGTNVGPLTTISFESIATSSSSYSKILDSANGLGGYSVGDWIKVSGAGESANNTYCKVVSVAAGELEVTGVDFTDESAGQSVTLTGASTATNGVTFRSYAIEKEFTDLSNQFVILNGMTIDSFNLTIPLDGIITCGFGFLGKIEAGAVATAGDGSNTAAAANDVMNSIDHVVKVIEGQLPFGITGFSMNLQNNHRALQQVANLGAVDVGQGSVAIDGTLQAYFSTKTEMDKYRNFTTSLLAPVFEDADGNAYAIDLPKVKYTGGRQVAGGKNTDIIADLSWQAVRDPTEDVTIRIAKW